MQPMPDTVEVVKTLKLAIILLKEHSSNVLAIPMDPCPAEPLAERLLFAVSGN